MVVLTQVIISFYATGPKGYNSENNTNINLFEDKLPIF